MELMQRETAYANQESHFHSMLAHKRFPLFHSPFNLASSFPSLVIRFSEDIKVGLSLPTTDRRTTLHLEIPAEWAKLH
jgi:hypothetical protein